jgi:hypothetical protein
MQSEREFFYRPRAIADQAEYISGAQIINQPPTLAGMNQPTSTPTNRRKYTSTTRVAASEIDDGLLQEAVLLIDSNHKAWNVIIWP